MILWLHILILPAYILDKNYLLTRRTMTNLMSYISFIITVKHWHNSWSLPFPQTPDPINQQAFLILPSKNMADLSLTGFWGPSPQNIISVWTDAKGKPTELSHSPPPTTKAHLPQPSHSHKRHRLKTPLFKTIQRLPTAFRMKSKLLPRTCHFLRDLAPAYPYKTISYGS